MAAVDVAAPRLSSVIIAHAASHEQNEKRVDGRENDGDRDVMEVISMEASFVEV